MLHILCIYIVIGMQMELVHHCIKSSYARDCTDYYFTPLDTFKSTGLEHSVVLQCLRDVEEEKEREILNRVDVDCIDIDELNSFHSACERMRTWING